jgi:hypothetical protein
VIESGDIEAGWCRRVQEDVHKRLNEEYSVTLGCPKLDVVRHDATNEKLTLTRSI